MTSGLPKEHSSMIGKVYSEQFSNLFEFLKSRTFKLTRRVEIVDFSVKSATADEATLDRKMISLRLKFWSVIFQEHRIGKRVSLHKEFWLRFTKRSKFRPFPHVNHFYYKGEFPNLRIILLPTAFRSSPRASRYISKYMDTEKFITCRERPRALTKLQPFCPFKDVPFFKWPRSLKPSCHRTVLCTFQAGGIPFNGPLTFSFSILSKYS